MSFFLGFVSGINISAVIPANSRKEFTNIDDGKESRQNEIEGNTEEGCIDVEIPTSMKFATGINEEMSFKEAYESARNEVGKEGFFNWKGNSYHTLTKEEWDSLSEEERASISERIQENSNFEFTKIRDEDNDNGGLDDFEFEDKDESEDNTGDESDEEEEIDEITIDDLIPDDETEEFEYVELDDFAETEDIISGLNDGEAETDEYNSSKDIASNDGTEEFLKRINDLNEGSNDEIEDYG
ncbi:hypothetical protein [Gramella sp. KN1008]|uniref:hypothetical protein n=1 Tax=Gramella sp. KN1008 TaxID=2529298 RepID=UPI00103F8F03|nr:hypothetical protein [Gramella sp. KN1008]